jgi:glucokinase
MLLAGDIGGTKTDLALFSPEAGPRATHAQAEFPSASRASTGARSNRLSAAAPRSIPAAGRPA